MAASLSKLSTNRLIEEGVSLMTAYLETNRTRTDLLKQLAELIVELRSRHTLEDGTPDWSGRTPEYRQAISEIYRRGGVPESLNDTIQAALRYHVGNLLRNRAPQTELKHVGLTSTSPKERMLRQRRELTTLRDQDRVSRATGKKRRPDLLSALSVAQDLLYNYGPEDIRGLTAEDAKEARVFVEAINSEVSRLLAVYTQKKPSNGKRAQTA